MEIDVCCSKELLIFFIFVKSHFDISKLEFKTLKSLQNPRAVCPHFSSSSLSHSQVTQNPFSLSHREREEKQDFVDSKLLSLSINHLQQ
ncbi:hypothetical protein FRX31_026490, partial [Thalictrum thalictroides]